MHLEACHSSEIKERHVSRSLHVTRVAGGSSKTSLSEGESHFHRIKVVSRDSRGQGRGVRLPDQSGSISARMATSSATQSTTT